MRRNARGFTLMELMVVIVIVAILAAVAVPLYINYVKDAQRTEAKGAIRAIITGEQAFYQKQMANGKSPAYTANFAELNVDLSDLGDKWKAPEITVTGDKFVVKVTSTTGGNDAMWVQCTYERGKTPQWDEH